MKILTADQVRRVYETTDSLGLNRQWLVIPLARQPEGIERILPDGKIYITVPEAAAFEEWIGGLSARLSRLNTARTPKTAWREAARNDLLAHAPPGSEGPPFSYTQKVGRPKAP